MAFTDSALFSAIYSQFLWELTRGASYSPSMDEVSEWISKISELLGVAVQCTQSIYKTLVWRANHLRQKARKFKGGLQRRRFMEQTWAFTIHSSDSADSAGDTLDSLRHTNSELRATVKTLERDLSVASELVKKVQSGTAGTRGKRRCSQSPPPYSQRHKRRLRSQRADGCSASLAWMEQEGYQPLKVLALNIQTCETEMIDLRRDLEVGLQLVGESLGDDQVDIISMMLYTKDRFNVSGLAYHEMAKLCKEMPRHYRLKNKIAELNKLWDITPTPNGVVGVQQSLKGRLGQRIQHLVRKTPPSADFKVNRKVRVKLSGDGTSIGKRLHVINFTYTLLDDGDQAHSFEGNHPLAIFREQENYYSLKKALEDVVKDVLEFKCIEVDGTSYDIVYYLGGNWKFLAIVTGKYHYENKTQSTTFCYCVCVLNERLTCLR